MHAIYSLLPGITRSITLDQRKSPPDHRACCEDGRATDQAGPSGSRELTRMMRIQPIGCESLLLRLYLYFIIRSPFLPLNAGWHESIPDFS